MSNTFQSKSLHFVRLQKQTLDIFFLVKITFISGLSISEAKTSQFINIILFSFLCLIVVINVNMIAFMFLICSSNITFLRPCWLPQKVINVRQNCKVFQDFFSYSDQQKHSFLRRCYKNQQSNIFVAIIIKSKNFDVVHGISLILEISDLIRKLQNLHIIRYKN